MNMRERVRVGVIGTTWYAETHLRALQSAAGADLVALSGRNGERAAEVAGRFDIPHVFPDYEGLVDSGLLDAVVIVAPDELHHPITMRALDAGLHVLCEKPLATSAAQAKEMHERAESLGLVNMSFFALRNSPHHQYLHELVNSGAVGTIRTAQFELSHGFFRGPGYQWRFDAQKGTGALGDLGCYLIDQARWYVGEIGSISAHLASFVGRPREDGTDYPAANDSAHFMAEFENGAHGVFSVTVVANQAERRQYNRITLHGDRGTVELRHTFAGAELVGALDEDAAFRVLEIPRHFDKDSSGASQRLTGDQEFIEAIRNGTFVRPSFYDGWRVQETIEAAFAAANTRCWAPVGGQS
jgi:predicted dehydrogenase